MEHALAREILKWHEANGGGANNDADLKFHALRLLHEAVELCIASGAHTHLINNAINDELYKATVRKELGKLSITGMFEEIADVAILLEVLAAQVDLSIDDIVRMKLKTLLLRKWNCDEHGVLWRLPEKRT